MKTKVYVEGWNCLACGHDNLNTYGEEGDKCEGENCTSTFNAQNDFQFEEIEVDFPSVWEICGDCQGNCTTYLGWAAKDQPAFTSEDFYQEGPDFYEDYMNGRYDAQCPGCKGTGKVKVIDEKTLQNTTNKWLKAMYEEYLSNLKAEYEYQAICAAERRMGA